MSALGGSGRAGHQGGSPGLTPLTEILNVLKVAARASLTGRVAGISADEVSQSDAHREGTAMECCSMNGCVSSGFDIGSAFDPLDGTIGILRTLRETFLTPVT
jgi:hypothetical protein